MLALHLYLERPISPAISAPVSVAAIVVRNAVGVGDGAQVAAQGIPRIHTVIVITAASAATPAAAVAEIAVDLLAELDQTAGFIVAVAQIAAVAEFVRQVVRRIFETIGQIFQAVVIAVPAAIASVITIIVVVAVDRIFQLPGLVFHAFDRGFQSAVIIIAVSVTTVAAAAAPLRGSDGGNSQKQK